MKELVTSILSDAITTLKSDGILNNDITPTIQVTHVKDKAHGDLASNLAMMLAKSAKCKPRDLAESIVKALPQHHGITKIEIAGPGFINFFIDDNWLTNQINEAAENFSKLVEKTRRPQTVVVDYSSPNLAKEMHVGHLRSSIIGDAVVRTLEYLGHKVIRQNHVGDWGTQFGMLLAHMEQIVKQHPNDSFNLGDLEIFYREAKKQFDDSTKFADRSRQLVVKLQSGDDYCLKLWKTFRLTSLNHCNSVYAMLNVSLNSQDVRGESDYNNDLQNIIDDLEKKNLLTVSDGASCVFLDEFTNQEGNPLPLIVKKADGGFLYATIDLAAIRYRQQKLKANHLLYFVDQRQSLHFQQIFKVARLANFVDKTTQCEHMGFGTMNGDDGKPFKTRTGGTVKLVDLLNEAKTRAYTTVKQKNPDLTEDELRKIADVVGISAVKYADLSKNRTSDYTFSMDAMLSLQGNTAPYLLYAYTRIASILKNSNVETHELKFNSIHLKQEEEKQLAAKLIRFNEVVNRVADKGSPHLLCTYLFELSSLLSTFYEKCHILKAEDAATKMSRLKLVVLVAEVIKQSLSLLGIKTLDKM